MFALSSVLPAFLMPAVAAGLGSAASECALELHFFETNGGVQLKRPRDVPTAELKIQPIRGPKAGKAMAR